MKRHPEIKDTNFNRNRICAKLIQDPTFAADEAIQELNFWNKYHHGNIRKVLASYNGGIKGNPSYAQKAIKIIQQLK